MYKFEKGNDYATFTDDKVKLSFSMEVKKMETSFYVNIPSLNINFYARSEDEIPKSAQESLESYFNYWYKEKNADFLDHMLNLGFVARRGGRSRLTRKRPQKVLRRRLNEEFTL